MVEINYWAVLVSAVAAVVVGALWYGPVFGKFWMSLVGLTTESMKSMKMSPFAAMAGGFLGALFTAFVLAHHLVFANAFLGTTGAESGLMSAFWVWLGFYVPVTAGSLLWEGKSWKLFALNAAYYLVTLAISGVILALWV